MTATNVLFVEPRGATNTFSRFMSIPLLGPVYLGTIARNAGFNVSIFNENIMERDITDEELAWADELCLSCLTPTVERGKEIATKYRTQRQQRGLTSRSHIGGIHASMLPDDVAPYFDHVVVGEAEEIIVPLLQGKFTEKIIKGIPVKDLDSIPIPDFSLLRGRKKNAIAPIMTSRGCPYDCNFCSVTEMFGRGYRTQSPERVLQEAMSVRGGRVFFVDDNFAANVKRSRRVLDLMEQQGFKRKWSAQVRTDITRKPDLVQQMRHRGCEWVYVGLESINPASLVDMQKNQTVDDIRRSMKTFHKHGIRVHGMFMFGSDPDTAEVFANTRKFARECHIDSVQYNVLTPLPGTRLFHRLANEGRLLHRNWEFFDGLHVVFRPKNMSARELQEGMISALRDFYTYANACRDALGTATRTCWSFMTRLGRIKNRIPVWYGPMVKLFGRGIVREWVRANLAYVNTLK